ncbi:amino acid adenylation domain-containing protein [Actinophytocola sp.]|uniref:amino acid adenylation domain-containing protein n=1 Tax=Actinophytocola sp. TaxID=1872138 RepID=UPI003D6C522F
MPARPNALSAGAPLDRTESDPPDACSALLRAAERHPGNAVVAVTSPGNEVRLGYPDLLLRARRLLGGLRARGCRTGDPVVLHGLPLPDFFPALWACLLGGLRPVTVAEPVPTDSPTDPPTAAAERLAHVCRLLGRPVVLTGPGTVAALRHVADRFDAGRPAAVTGVDECVAAEPADDLHQPDPDDVALLMLSSGSTGLPKAIQLTHRGLAEFAAATRRVIDVRSEHTTVNWMPLDHSGALLIYHVLGVFVGCTNVHAPTDLVLGDPLLWLDLLDEHRAQHSWAPNFAYQLVADALDGCDRAWDLSGVSTLVSGGEQVTVPVVSRFLDATRRFGIRDDRVRPAWGMAETTTAVTFGRYTPAAVHRLLKSSTGGDLEWAGEDTPDRDCVTLVAVGPPMPGAEVRVVDQHGEVLPERRIGRLQVRSCRNTPGYLGDENGTRALFPDHDRTGRAWLDSGDLAFLTGGEVVITGRAKDVIILNGHNYFCHEIEDVVATVPGLAAGRIAACGVPDERTGSERLHVFVATDLADPASLLGEVRAVLFDRLRLSGCRVVAVPEREFPRTPSGKVRRAALRERAAATRVTMPVRAPGRERGLVAKVREILGSVLGREVDADTPFYELGLTSVGLLRARGVLSRELDREIEPTAMFRYPTVTALAGHLAGLLSGPAEPTGSPASGGRVAIIGLALRFPGASTLDGYWANLRDGVDSVRRFTSGEVTAAGVPAELAAAPTFQPVGGVLDDVDAFDASYFGVSPREAELTDPAHRLFLQCCHHALEHAGYAGPGRRIGVFAGGGMNLYGHQDAARPGFVDGPAALQATIGSEPDFLASRVAYRLGLTGPAIGVRTACSSSLVAVHLAAQAVLTGDADLALAGAAAVRVPQEAGYRYHEGSILSPTGRCRAFDASADGTVGGNGVAAVVLKPLDAALADGDTVHAVILGSAVNNDGTGKVGFTAPSVPGQLGVIRQALHRAGVPAETISYVEAHGTGTPLGDPVEFDALREAFAGVPAGSCALGSVKPNVGHLDSCAGMAGLIKVALMLGHRSLVPTINLSTPNPVLRLAGSPFTLAVEHREWTVDGHPRRAGVSALGVGGTNAHVILEEPPSAPPRDGHGRAVLVPVSAADEESVGELAWRLRDHLRANPHLDPADVAATLGAGRRHLASRLAVVGRSAAELADGLDAVVDAGVEPLPPVGPLVFAFSGQDGVRAGLAGGLYTEFPVVREVLDECERARPGLLEQLRGGEVHDPQPVLFAFQAALAELWRAVGVEPAVVAGHSLGEYAALYAAGALSLVDGLRLTAARGEAMRQTVAGGMVAVNAEAAVAERLAAASGTEIAAVNAPGVHVLSGAAEAVSRAVGLAGEERIGCVRLEVDHAFHSALVEPALAELARQAEAVELRPLRVPMVSGLDGRLLPAGHLPDGDYLCRQARAPVRFDLVLSSVDGRDVLEVGPGEALTRLARRAGAHWLTTVSQDADTFLTALGTLYRRGTTIDWTALTTTGRRIPLPGYPFRKQRFPSAPTDVPDGTPDRVRDSAPDQAPGRGPDRLEDVRRRTARLLGTDVTAVDPDRTFVDLGGDSLSLMNLTRDLTETFGVRIPIRTLFGDADTPRKLAALLSERAPNTAPDPATAAAEPVTAEPATPTPHVAPAGRSSAVDTTPAVTTASGDGELQAVVEQQLAVAGQLVDRVTALMSEQLAAFRAPEAAPAAAPVGSAAPPADSVPATPSVHTTTAPVPSPAPSAESAAPTGPVVPTPAPVPSAESVEAAPDVVRAGAVDFSLYFFGDYPDEQETDKYGLITAAARFADRHGFRAVWLPERHFNSFGALFPNPSVLAAALAAQTTRVRLHAGSVVLPLHDPIRVAEEWSVVDNLSGGRVGLCVASGWHATDFVLAPGNFGRHRDLMYTQLDTVRRLWAGESVPATSGSGDQVEIRTHPRPLQAMPPMYVAVVGNPDSYRRAAARNLGVVTNLMTQSVERLAANIALYRRTRAEHGLDPAAGHVVVLVHTYLGDDLDQVRAEAYAPFCAYLRSSLSLFDQVTTSLGMDIDLASTPEDDVEFLLGQAYRRYCDSRALIGTADGCAEVVTSLLAAGADEIACFVDFGVPGDRVLAALPTLDGLRTRFAEGRRSLTAAQRRIWFLDRLYPNQTIYHEPKAIRLTGPLNPAALQSALQRVVDRQPALRSVFRDDGGEPYRVELSRIIVDCPVVDGSTEEEALREALRTTEVFDLGQGPLLAARLVRISAEHHLLFLSAHHIVFDSSSTSVLVRDLAAYYRSWPGEPDGLPTLSTSDLDEQDATDEDVEFWRGHLAGAPELRLPTDRPRPANRSGAGGAVSHELDGELVERLAAFTQANGVTFFMAILGAVAAVLGRFSGQDDLVLGTAVSNRPPRAADLVGLFLDTVPLRVDLSGDPSFTGLAHRVRDTTTDAYEHRGVPFDELVGILNPERDPVRNPLFDVMVEFENESTVDFTPEVAAAILDVPADRAPFDLSLYLTRHTGGLRISVEYDSDLFTAATVRRLLDHFEATLRRAVDDPAVPLSTLTSATGEERADLARWQGDPLPEPPCLHELVESQVDRTPDATAVLGTDGELTYRELDERANRLANGLLARGISRGDLVAVRLDRGPELIVTLLAVLKAGAAYLPLDLTLPQARVDLVLADSSAALLLTVDTLPEDGPATRPSVPVGPADLAYCVYTSGSSGRPKGVLVPHRGPANVVRWQAAQSGPHRTLQWTSPAFDVSVQEIFGTLAAGACLVLIDDEARHDPAAVVAVAREHRVERVFMPFTPLKYLLESRPRLPDLRMVVSAGEPMVLTPAVRRFFAEHPDCLLYNQYGPTEGSIIVTSHRVDPARADNPPIGAPIAGITVELLDPRGEPVPVGATGEIHIGGPAVADGYLGRAAETAAAFVVDPSRPGARRYRTGDLGRWRGDGTIEFLGRRDDQVKIRGFRVEPGETERALADLPGVRDAAVVARSGPSGEPELVAYVVPANGTALDALASRLRDELPHYLVPHQWVALDRLPVTPNGKLDRRRLPEPGSDADPVGAEPTTPTERVLHELWGAELGRSPVPVDRSFFALGGHSLSVVRLLNRVGERLGRAPSMTEFFRNPTIRGLAGLLDGGDVVDTAPLTTTQRRLWRRHHALANPAVYNVAHRVDLTGDLDPEALRRAVEALVHRHAALRMRVAERDGELVQEVLAPAPVPLDVHEVRDADAWCAEVVEPPFDLRTAPLHRIRLGRLGPDRWVLVVVLNHMICDGVSMGIVWRELAELYAAAREGREPGLPAAVPHADYARWAPTAQRRAELERFWRTELSEVDIVPRLPADRPRPRALSGRGALHESVLPADLAHGVEEVAAAVGGTPYAVLATAFAAWLARACGRTEVVLAASSANRTRPEHEDVVGLVGDAVLVRVRPGESGLAEQVRAFSAGLYAALDHQDLPLDDVAAVVAPELVPAPEDWPFPTVRFTVVTTPPPRLDLDGVESRVRGVAVPGVARTELYVRVEPGPDGPRIFWEYSTDLFTAATVAAWDADLRALLTRLVRPAS